MQWINQRVSRWNTWETAEATYWVQTRKEIKKQENRKAVRTKHGAGTNRAHKQRSSPLKMATCAAQFNTGYYHEAALYFWCSCILLKHRRWAMLFRRSQGRYLDLLTEIAMIWALSKNQTCFTLPPPVFISASEQSLEIHLLFHDSQRWLTCNEQTRAV